jgi:hypothetical protein
MSLFKGSEGKWIMHPIGEAVTTIDGKFVCLTTKPGIAVTEEKKYNALLISKAPEMLGAIIKAKHTLRDVYGCDVTDLENLIKEATTLTRVELVQVFWDVDRQEWEKSKEEVEEMGRIVRQQYVSMASRIDYWVEKSIV